MLAFFPTLIELSLCISVARIALVSPTRSSQIESILLRMAQTGQLRGRVGEEQLISLLEQVYHFLKPRKPSYVTVFHISLICRPRMLSQRPGIRRARLW